MNTKKIKKEMLKRIPELKRIQRNPNNDPEINAENCKIYRMYEGEIEDFFNEIVESLFNF